MKTTLLTDPEIDVLYALRDVPAESPWGMAIQLVMQSFSVAKFRQLICELLSQDADAPQTMENILGPAYPSFRKLSCNDHCLTT